MMVNFIFGPMELKFLFLLRQASSVLRKQIAT